jgi:serine/threonine-protein kinase
MVLREKYRLDGVLGVGGMAAVYVATHRNRKQFAIKILHPEVSADGDIRSRFLREGYVANSVNHAGAVAVLDDDEAEDGSAFLVMELLEGASFDVIWDRLGRRIPLGAALCVVHQLLDVLGAAHDNRIVHRDIKPSNLFLVPDGQLKVLDFGIARLRDAATSAVATGVGAMLGTPAFMAPEQALGLATEVDERSDIWSVGATLFTLTTGQFVHEGDSQAQLLVRAATQRARSLAEIAPEMPPAVVALVAKALAFEKELRWQSAQSMRDTVASVHADLYGQRPSKEHLTSLFENPQLAGAQSRPRISVPATASAFPSPVSPLLSSAPPTTGPIGRTMTVQPGAAASRPPALGRRKAVPILVALAFAGAITGVALTRKKPLAPWGSGSAAPGESVVAPPTDPSELPASSSARESAIGQHEAPVSSSMADDSHPPPGATPAGAAPPVSHAIGSSAPSTSVASPHRARRPSGAASVANVPQANASAPSPALSAPRSPLDMQLQ